MNRKKWKKISLIFDIALTLPKERRTTYINNLCEDDPDLLREIDTLLSSVEESEQMLEEHLQKNEALLKDLNNNLEQNSFIQSIEGTVVGGWQVIELLGRGGMGDVYKVKRTKSDFQQQGALKIMRRGLNTRENIRRFRLEKQILAGLHHPNIASLIEGGVSENGLPYLVMEYIEGTPIDAYCDQRKLNIRERLELFKTVCEAVQHAHKNLIVHRDLKPDNILVTNEGRIKILDFGIAKLLDPDVYEFSTVDTQRGMRLMSLDYAAPEQITGEAITTSTDLYALGVLLYKLLAGTHPFDLENENYRSAVQIVREEPSPLPSQRLKYLNNPSLLSHIAASRNIKPDELIKKLKGDLDTIVLKALCKEANNRYDTADQLKDDITSYLQNKPILARGDTFSYRTKKFLKRHKTAVGLAVMFIMVIISLVSFHAYQITKERNKALQETQRAEEALAKSEATLDRMSSLRNFMVDLFRAAEPSRPRNQLPSTREVLETGAKRALNDQMMGAGERFELLLVLGEIYSKLNRLDQAEKLLDPAIELAQSNDQLKTEDLSRSLREKAWVELARENFNEAKKVLKNAQKAAKSTNREDLKMQLEADRAYFLIHSGEIQEALSILQDLNIRLENIDDPDPGLVYDIANPLGIAFRITGNTKSALEAYERANEATKKLHGPESLNYAITLANIGNTKVDLGRLFDAREDLQNAIILYDRIFEEKPAVYKAAALTNLSKVLLQLGQPEKALQKMTNGTYLWAKSTNIAPSEDPFTNLMPGWVLARSHQWAEATEKLERAAQLFSRDKPENPENHARALVLQAWIQCQQKQVSSGNKLLNQAAEILNGNEFEAENYRSEWYEAKASCLLAEKKPKETLDMLEKAFSLVKPGRLTQLADLYILKSNALELQEATKDACIALFEAEKPLKSRGLVNHPAQNWVIAEKGKNACTNTAVTWESLSNG